MAPMAVHRLLIGPSSTIVGRADDPFRRKGATRAAPAGCDQAGRAQAGDEGRGLHAGMRNGGAKPPALGDAAVRSGHPGRGPVDRLQRSTIDQHQAFGLEVDTLVWTSGRLRSAACAVFMDGPLHHPAQAGAGTGGEDHDKTPIAVLGIDLGENSCSLAGLDVTGAVVLRRRMTQEALVMFASKLPACVVATWSTMRFVTLKTEAQLALQVLHRARERLVAGRTRLTNQLRAVLLEHGVILPKRRPPLGKRLDELMAGDAAISARAFRLLQDLRDEWAGLDRRIAAYDDELAVLTREDEQAR